MCALHGIDEQRVVFVEGVALRSTSEDEGKIMIPDPGAFARQKAFFLNENTPGTAPRLETTIFRS